MEQFQKPETPLDSLIDKHVFVIKRNKDVEGKEQQIVIRAKVLYVENEKLKVEYEGNKNIVFDGNIETVSPIECASITYNLAEKPIVDLVTEETHQDFDPVVSRIGEWYRTEENEE
jgi:hypothetical protein